MVVALAAATIVGLLCWRFALTGSLPPAREPGSIASAANRERSGDAPRNVQRAFKAGALADLDTRVSPRAAQQYGTDAKHESAAAELRKRVPGVHVDYDAITGGPKNVMAAGRFLHSPKKVAAGAAGDPLAAVREFVDENRELFGHAASALEKGSARVTREDVTPHNGMRTMVWQQELDGIPLFQTILRANLTKNGDLVSIGGNFMADPVAASKPLAKDRAALVSQPPVKAERAITLAAANIGTTVEESAVKATGATEGAERKQRFEAPAISDTSAHLTWVPMSANSLRLAWEVTTMSTLRGEMFRVLIDAQTGDVIVRLGLTNYITEATFRVYAKPDFQPYDSPTPFAPGHSTPSSAQPAEVSRNLVTLQAENTTASPNGWIDDGGTQTLGNNVDAHTDTDANNSPDLPRPTSATRTFDFALDLTQAPSTYKDAAVVNLFYLCNWIHDKFYALGFTESAGNFQTNNFGRGGNGNDAVMADAQDGSGTNNANFSTPSDGSPGRMQMYVFTGPTPDRDGDLDHEIVIHEYTHGLSNRLVGGGVGISQSQSAGMGEGWSDFYALCLLSESGDDPNGCYAAGGYATRNFAGLAENYYFGIRRYPYSTDLLKNPLTFKDIDPTQASSHSGIPRSSIIGSTADEVHNQGEVWCATLWDMRANLVTKHGWAVGNQLVLQIVTDGMKLSPADPNFLQARDAIVQADLVNNAGANRNEIWAAFAKRGMGASATSPASSTTSGLVESYDMPDDLSVSPTGSFVAFGEAGGPFSPASKVYTLSNTGTASLAWTASVNQPWITVSGTGGNLATSSTTTVDASINSAANALANGLYSATIAFTNTTSGRSITRSVSLRVGQIDYFTELFDTAAPQDTDNQSFTFTPNTSPSGYSVAKDPAPSFPSDPAGGTSLAMSDDTSVLVSLTGGQQVALYGTSYSSFYVGSNGYVTFGSGDNNYAPTFATHFAKPRVAAFFDDLLPTTGQVTWKQWPDRAAITWLGVPEYGTTNSNNLQIELFFDGRIRITHLSVAGSIGLIGLSRGTGTPADFIESDFSSYFSLAISLALPSSATEGDGVLAGQGTVTRSIVSTSPLDVNLASSDATELEVPAIVTIPANATSATFDLTVGNDALLDGTRRVTVTGTTSGAAGAVGTMLIHDNETATLTLTLPATVTEGASGLTGSVTASAPVDRDVEVALDTSDKNNLLLPASVTIPSGQTSITFPITAVEDNRIESAQVINATAIVQGWSMGTATTIVEDNEPRVLSLTLPATPLEGDTGKTGTVTVSGVMAADLVVNLSSDDTSELIVSATVTIASGQSGTTFPLTIVNDTDVDGAQPVNVTASASGYTSGFASTSVVDDETPAGPTNPSPAHLQSNTHPDADLAWSYAVGTGGAPDSYDVYFGTNPSPGVAELVGNTATPSWTLPLLTGGTTYYWKIVAKRGAQTTAGPVWEFTVPLGGPPVRYQWSAIALQQLVDGPFPVTITGYDAENRASTSFNGPVDVVSMPNATVLITELNPNTPDAIEFTNVSSSPVDVSGWQIFVYDNTTYPAPLTVFTIPNGTTCAAGQIFRLTENGTAPGSFPNFLYGSNIDWTSGSGSTNAVLLRKADGTLVDFVGTAAGDPVSITLPVTIPVSQWSGATVAAPTNTTHGYLRTGSLDSNSATGWTVATPTIGTLNAGLTLPFPGENLVIDPATVTLTTGTWSGNLRVRTAAPTAVLSARDSSGNHGESNSFAVTTNGSISIGGVASVIENAGTVPSAISVTLTAAPASDVTVTLTSSVPALIASTSVVIPAGQTTGSATITVTDDLLLNGSRSVTFSASAIGYVGATKTVTVNDDETAALSLSAPTQATEGQGTLTAAGTVTVSAIVDAPVIVALTSGDTTEITVPSTVTIPAGQTSATFDITVQQDTVIDGTQPALISAQVTGWTSGTASIDVLDDEPHTMTITAATATEEGVVSIAGTITTPAPVAASLVVDLSSNDITEATVPATVTIPAGQSSATFTISIVDDATADGAQTTTLSASAATFTTATRDLLVRDNELHHFSFSTIADPQIRNVAFPVTILAKAIDDQTITGFTGSGALSSAVPVLPAATTAFSDGSWTGNVTMGGFGSGVQVTITGPGGVSSASNAFDVTHGALDHFAWSAIASPQFKNVPFAVTITAQDSANNPVLNFAGTANLAGSNATIVPAVTGPFASGVWSGSLTAQQTSASLTVTATNGSVTGSSAAFAVNALGALLLDVPPGVFAESAGTVNGTVGIPAARVVDVVVSLSSSDTSEIQLPASTVTIPAGQTSVSFTVTVIDDSVLDGSQMSILTASALGYDSRTHPLSVNDNETTTIAVTLPPSLVENGGTIIGGGTITLGAAPVSDVEVSLSSSEPNDVTVPDSVIVPAGQTTASFNVTLPDDIFIDGPKQVTITAHVEGWSEGTTTRTVLDDEGTAISVSLPFPVSEHAGTVTGTVSLAGIPETSVIVALSSSSPSDLTVPASVTIFAGNSSATFSATVIDDTLAEPTENLTVTGSAAGFTSGNALTFINDNDPASFAISTIPAQVTFGVPAAVTITAVNVSGSTIPTFSGVATFSASGSGGNVAVSPATTAGFSSGVWTGNVSFSAIDTNVTLTATSGAVNGTSNAFAVVGGVLDHFEWSPVGAVQYANVPFPVTIRARDVNGNAVLDFTSTANLTGHSTSAPTEVTIGSGTSSVGVLLGAANHDVRSQVIYTPAEMAGAGALSSLSLFVNSTPGQTLTNWTIRMKHTTRTDFATDKSWESSGWTTVHQSNQQITTTGWVAFPFTTNFDYNGTDNLLVDFSFNNSSSSFNGTVRYSTASSQRTIYASSNSAAGDPLAWSGTAPAATGSSTIWNIKLVRGAPPVPIVPAVTGAFANGEWSGFLAIATPVSSLTMRAADGSNHIGATTAFQVAALPIQTADTDGDGINDLLEVALGLDPAVRNVSGLPAVSVVTDSGDGKQYLTLQHRRRVQPGVIQYFVETSSSLSPAAWTSAAGDVMEVSVTPVGDGLTELRTLRIMPAVGTVPWKFARLRVQGN